MRLLDRYILGQILVPFGFGLVLFSTLWLAQILMKMIDLFVTKGVAFGTIVKIFVYSLPVVIATAAPMAVLLGVLMTVGRLSSDSELTAMQANGISFGRIAVPLVGFGLVVSVAVMALHEYVVPRATYLREQTTLNEVVLVKPLPKIAKDVFFSGSQEFTMFVRNYHHQNETMQDVTIFQFSKDKQNDGFPRVTEAQRGRMGDGGWTFTQGTTHVMARDGALRDEITFTKWFYPVDPRYADRIDQKPLAPREMSMRQLRAYIQDEEKRGADSKKDWVELYFKTAFPMASLFLTLMGAPLAIGKGRSGTSMGVGLSILIMFVYYILLGVGRTMGDTGNLSPAVAVWMPNLILGGTGVVLLYRATR